MINILGGFFLLFYETRNQVLNISMFLFSILLKVFFQSTETMCRLCQQKESHLTSVFYLIRPAEDRKGENARREPSVQNVLV